MGRERDSGYWSYPVLGARVVMSGIAALASSGMRAAPLFVDSDGETKSSSSAAMLGISHLFFPWGIILQAVALVHFFRRRPSGFWFFVIFFGGFLGALVYLVAEMVPDAGAVAEYVPGIWPEVAHRRGRKGYSR